MPGVPAQAGDTRNEKLLAMMGCGIMQTSAKIMLEPDGYNKIVRVQSALAVTAILADSLVQR